MIGLAAVPSSSSFTPSISLLPPFDLEGSRSVARCALSAQQKRRKQQQGGNSQMTGSAVPSSSSAGTHPPPFPASSSVSSFVPGFDSNESLLSGLPVNQVRYENPHRQGALFCRSGTWLEIGSTGSSNQHSNRRRGHSKEDDDDDLNHQEAWKGTVRGTRRESSRFSILEFITVAFGLVSIRGVASQHYLCMDGRGRLYSAPQSKLTPECVFMEEMLENYYNLYSSCSYGSRKRPWYVALRKTGRVRKGQHTRKKQKSSHFLVIHFDNQASRSRADGTIMDSYGHAATRIHPDFLGYAAENWRSFYSTTISKDKEGNEKKKQQNKFSAGVFSLPKGSPTAGPQQLADLKLRQTTMAHPQHHQRHHNHSHHQLPSEPLVVVVDSTVVTASEKFRKDMRRRRRLEREERQRQARKMELEKLRLSTIHQRPGS